MRHLQKVAFTLAFLLFIVAPIACHAQRIGAGVGVHNHSSGTQGGAAITPSSIAVTGSITSTKACATNFTRKAPNLCMRDDAYVTAAAATSCTAVTLPDASAKVLLYAVDQFVASNNAIAQRSNVWRHYGSGACTTVLAELETEAREWVATVGAQIHQFKGTYWVQVPSGGLWELATNGGIGGAGNGTFRQIRGYVD